MSNLKISRINFYDDLFEKQNIPECISRIGYKDRDYLLYKSESPIDEELGEKKVYAIQIVPDFLAIKYDALFNNKVLKEYRLGYAAKLNQFTDVKSYVKSQYRDRHARGIFKNIKRLETRFEVSYTLFYGNIERDKYDFIMDCLHKMLKKRFEERNDTNYIFQIWPKLYNSLFEYIKLKKASFFVIYNGCQPIQITIQYHFKDILISSVPSYDINYRKFSLGNTALYKQIEWCINNGYSILDLGHGDLPNKRRWSNMIYDFDYHVVYSKDNLKSILSANLEFFKMKIKAFLRSKKADVKLRNFKNSFSKSSNKIDVNEKDHEIINLSSFDDENKTFKKIEWQSIEYEFLMKFVCDFIYYNPVHFNEVQVFQDQSERKNFILKGKNKFQKIIFY